MRSPRTISTGRRVIFLGLCGLVTVVAFALAARGVKLWRERDDAPPAVAEAPAAAAATPPAAPMADAPHLGIDDGLRTQCVMGADECLERYGGELIICRVPDCAKHQMTTDAQGFVGPPGRVIDEQRPAGTYRVLAHGGSTTGGAAWDCGWPGQLEAKLTERAAAEGVELRFEVLNLGLPSAGSAEIAALDRVIGARYEVDAVVIGEEVNDLGNCAALRTTPGPVTGQPQGDLLAAFLSGSPMEPLAGMSEWFARHEDDWIERRRERRLGLAAERARQMIAPRIDLDDAEIVKACRAARLPPLDDTPSFLDDYLEGWHYTRRHLEQVLDGVAARSDAKVVLSTTPHGFEAWGCPTAGCLLIRDLADWRAYLVRVHNPEMRRLAAERGLLLADLEERLAELAPGESAERYFAEWMHMECEGYAVVADVYLELLWPDVLARAAQDEGLAEGR